MTKKELKEILHACKYGKCGLEEAEEIIGRELDGKISEQDIVDVLKESDVRCASSDYIKENNKYRKDIAKAIMGRIK